MTLQESYPEVWSAIERHEIPKKKIDEFLLRFIKKILLEVQNHKRDDMDIGDAFGIGMQHATIEGYKINPALEQFLIELGDYRVDLRCDGKSIGTFNTPEEVEAELKKVAKELGIDLEK